MAGEQVVNGFQFQGQVDKIGKGFVKGLCDPDFFDIRQAAEPFRHTRGVFLFNIDSATQLSMPAGYVLTLLTDGVGGQPAQGYPTALTPTETDSNKGGALSKRQGKFKIQAVGFRVLRPFVFNTAQGQEGNKIDSSEFDGYELGMARAILDGTAVKLKFQDEDCNLDLSNPALWAQHAGPAGANIVTNGVPFGPSSIEALRAVVLAGERDATDQATFEITMGRGYQLRRPNNPIDTQTYPIGSKVGIELDLVIYGNPLCSCEQCPVDFSGLSLTDEQIKMLQRRMGYSG